MRHTAWRLGPPGVKVVILCGGRGIRSFPFTHYLPKPMMPIGGSPIVVHLIRNFVRQGFTQFVLSAGHRSGVLIDYFQDKQIGAEIEIVDTGDDADTGDRVLRCRDHIDGRFIVAYGDGLSDVPLARLAAFHAAHGGLATMTAVPMPSQYGVVDMQPDGRVQRMREKPLIEGHWINVGFIVFEPEVFGHWKGASLERHVLPHLVAQGAVHAYRHDGFFKSADSYKDIMEFEELMDAGALPWVVESVPA